MGAHLRLFLQAMVATPDARVTELARIGPREERSQLTAWSRSAEQTGRCVHELIEEQAALRPVRDRRLRASRAPSPIGNSTSGRVSLPGAYGGGG